MQPRGVAASLPHPGNVNIAEDWLAALVRDALVGAYGGAEPPASAWLRLRLTVKQHGEVAAGRGRRETPNLGELIASKIGHVSR